MAARKGCCVGGCLLKMIIAIVIIIALLAGTALVVLNMTMEKLGLADVDLGGQTLREMGLAQTKLKDVINLLRSLLNPDESKIVTNPYDPVADKASADATVAGIGIPTNDGNTDYLSLLGDDPITTEEPMLVSFADTEVAYILDSMVNQASDLTEGEGEEEAATIRDMNARIVQVTITKGATISLEIMLKINISSIKEGIPYAGSLLPDNIFLNSVNKLIVDENGLISTESQSIQINGMSDAAATAIINAIFNSLSNNPEAEDPAVFFNDTMGELFGKVMNNIGQVGDAELNTEDEVIVSTIDLGEEGVATHRINLITRVNEEE